MTEYILVVDDDPGVRGLISAQIKHMGYECRSAANGNAAITIAEEDPFPFLVLSDVQMPGMGGLELLHNLKELDASIQVVMVSGMQDIDTVRRSVREGAYDYLIKPFEMEDLARTVERGIERYRLRRMTVEYQEKLELTVQERTEELRQTRDIALLTLAKLAESRDSDTGQHLERIAEFSARLAQELGKNSYSDQVDADFIVRLHKSSPLHDIGKVGISDAILRKPGKLTDDEFITMQAHTTIGGDTLRTVIERYEEHTFLTMAMEIAYSHHERWDGRGYPAEIGETEIPLGARIVTLVDAYDAITSERPYKPAYSHQEAIRRILVDREKHFDPTIVDAFMNCEEDILDIQHRLKDAMAGTKQQSESTT